MPCYECDRCGACCRELIIDIDYVDVLREPRLREVSRPFRIGPDEKFVDNNDNEVEITDGYMVGAMLAAGRKHPCRLLGADNRCTIYSTRPNCCVAMQAGDEQCQMARKSAGLTPLAAKNEKLL